MMSKQKSGNLPLFKIVDEPLKFIKSKLTTALPKEVLALCKQVELEITNWHNER